MENKTCTVCIIEKTINNSYKSYSECNDCNIKRGVKPYYNIKDNVSIQQKLYYKKNRDKLLQKQNDYRNKRNTDYKELLKPYVELRDRLKALGEKSHTKQIKQWIDLY